MRILCSAGKGEMDHQACLACSRTGDQQCGYDYVVLRKLYANTEDRPDIHATDLTGCLRKAWYSKTMKVAETPHSKYALMVGSIMHEGLEGSDEFLASELPFAIDGVVGKADVVYEDGRLLDLKCQPAGELVTMADGSEKPIETIKILEDVLSWDGEQFAPARVSAIMDGGVQDVYEIRIASGQVIRVSGNHPVLTDRGFVRADELIVHEDKVVNLTNWAGSTTMPIEDARLLGYLIGDGGTSRKYGIRWSNKDDELIDDFRQIVEDKGWDFHTASKKHLNDINWRISNRGLKQSTTGPMAFIQQYNIHGKLSWQKTIPSEIMAGNRDVVTNYLAAHFDTDGTISDPETKKKIPSRLSITTTSEVMAHQLGELLRRLGVVNRIHRQPINMGGRKMRDAYMVCVWQADMILRFGEIIPFRCRKKRDRFIGWTPMLREKLRKGGKNMRRIESAINLGPMQTIGLEVEGTHTYITNGVVTHNTTRWLYPSKVPYGSHALQVNIYAYFLKKTGRKVNRLQIQYLDMSGPTKCRKCRVPVMLVEGEFKCPICNNFIKNAHMGAVMCEVRMMDTEEIETTINERKNELRTALDAGMPPAKEPGFLCDYCAFKETCAPELNED